MKSVMLSLGSLTIVVILLKLAAVPGAAQTTTAPAKTWTAAKADPTLKTPWGEPDLQGIWTDLFYSPLERPAKYAGREFLTDAERKEFDQVRAKRQGFDFRKEVQFGPYNEVYHAMKYTGRRTSLIVDPPDGKIPPLTPEALKRQAAFQEPQAALARRIASRDNPEDQSLGVRCLQGVIFQIAVPIYFDLRRIVQTPGGISMVYDQNQGQGFQRNIVMNGSPHLPSNVRQWHGDSRGRWEGNTLVIDVTNFSPKGDGYQGSVENLHVVERYTRTGPTTIDYTVTLEDPTTWTRPWTINTELQKQNEEANRIYYDNRCQEGNYGTPALLRGSRVEDKAFAEGKGPDPTAQCTPERAGCGNAEAETAEDPFQ
jgi:hypothetical protein